MSGNILAQLALLLWMPFSLWVGSRRKANEAALVILIGGALFLPERVAYDFPVVPPLDKHAIAALCAFLACLVNSPGSIGGPQNTGATRWVMVLALVSIVGTLSGNGDPQRFGPVQLPGLSAYDGVALFVNWLLRVILPFYLGQTLFRTCDDLRTLLRGLVVGALVYVPLILLEVRLSPILHLKLYGFFQHDFIQAVRSGGFRAFVFMSHGLAVAFYMSQALTAATGLARVKDTWLPLSSRWTTIILTAALITCKSMGAFIYAGVSVPAIWFSSVRAQFRLARWLSLAVLVYPFARLMDLISTEWFIAQARAISEDRSLSLEFRFINENLLLTRAQLRPYFGWGSWGRNQVFDEDGRMVTVTDGEWIIQFGIGGVLGFAIIFGMLLLPVFRAGKASRLGRVAQPEDDKVLATVALLLAFTGLDLIPNAISHGLPYVIAGALMSVSSGLLAAKGDSSRVGHATPDPGTRSLPNRTIQRS